MTAHPDLAFAQRIRFAADVLCEVAAYRSRIRHGGNGIVNEHSRLTPYTAAQLNKIASDIKIQESLDRIAEIKARINHDSHDLGEFGRMIRVEYVENILNDLQGRQL